MFNGLKIATKVMVNNPTACSLCPQPTTRTLHGTRSGWLRIMFDTI